jgi:Fe-S cluster biogenesis protein NfuA
MTTASDNPITAASAGAAAEPLQIRTARTPNPNAWKYILSADVKREGPTSTAKVSYTDALDCAHVPLAVALLALANVTQVHFFENVITVTQNGASEWGDLDPAVQSVIKAHVGVPGGHDPLFADSPTTKPKPDRSLLPKDIQEIDAILDREVRPALQADGGDLEVLELDGNILTVRFQGACGGCPSAMAGTLQAIESILRSEFNPYLEIVTV